MSKTVDHWRRKRMRMLGFVSGSLPVRRLCLTCYFFNKKFVRKENCEHPL